MVEVSRMKTLPAFVRHSSSALALSLAAVSVSACVGERPPQGAPITVDDPKIEPRCQGDSTQLAGDVHVAKAADLVLYAGCRQIGGNVVIESAAGVTDVAALASIETIDGYLYVGENPALTTLEALEGVTRIGRGILIESNPALVAVNFPALTETAGNVVVENNAVLESVAFAAVTEVRPALVDIDGQGTLAPQGGAIVLANNPLVTTIDFGRVVEIEGNLDIRGMDGLTTLTGFEALTEITGTLSFGVTTDDQGDLVEAPNAVMTSLEGLQNIESIGGDVVIGFFPALATLSGLGALEDIGGDLLVLGNNALLTLGGMAALERIGGDLNLGLVFDVDGFLTPFGNAALRTVDLDTLEEIGGDLVAVDNDALETLRDMEDLVTLGGDVIVAGNGALENLELPPLLLTLPGDLNAGVFTLPDGSTFVVENGTDDFGAPVYTAIEGDLLLGGQTPDNLEAFAAITRIGGRLALLETDLTTTDGLDALVELGALEIGRTNEVLSDDVLEVSFLGNDALVAIEGFDVLTTVGNIDVVDAPALTTFDFPAVAVGGALRLAGLGGLETLSLDVTAIGGDFFVGVVRPPSGRLLSAGAMGATSLTASALLSVAGEVIVSDATLLETIESNALASVGGGFALQSLPALESVSTTALATVTGELSVLDCDALLTFDHALNSAGGLFVANAPGLGLAFPALATVDGDVDLLDSDAATIDFSALTSIDGDLRLENSSALEDLTGLAALATIGGDLVLVGNAALQSAAALAALTSVDGALIARENPAFDAGTLETLNTGLDEQVPVLTCGNDGDDAC